MKCWFRVLFRAGKAWMDDGVMKHSAAVSFYTLFSLAPVAIIALAVAGFFFGQEAASGQFSSQMTQLVGKDAAKTILESVAASHTSDASVFSTIIGVVLMLFGATTVFGQLQESLNEIWGVTARPSRSGWVVLVMQRLISFAMVLTVGFLLLVSLVVTTALTALVNLVGMEETSYLARGADFVGAILIITVLFALIFKVMPDVKLRWSNVWRGALVTSLLFSIGRVLIALYLGHSTLASTYGAAGSLVALLVWIYYSSAILFYGVEFTRAYVTEGGGKIVPKETAVRVTRQVGKS